MKSPKKLLLGLLALMFVFGGHDAQAASKTAAKQASKAPITIEADELYFSDLSGDLFAKGNVNVVQNGDKIVADELHGNTKQTEVWTDSGATLSKPGTTMTGQKIDYNYHDRTGSFDNARGTIEEQRRYHDFISGTDQVHTINEEMYVHGDNITLSPVKTVVNHGTVTTCSAQVPDYHISADRVEIYPHEKLILYNAKFWIKNTVIFSMPKYEEAIKDGDAKSQSPFPRLGYGSDEGFEISQYLQYPLSNKVSLFGDIAYYSKQGFKPTTYGAIDHEKGYTLKLLQGSMENGDDEWVKKEPELSLALNPYVVPHTNITANFVITDGRWVEDNVSGWRQDFNFYLKNAPIHLSDKVTLNLGTGFEKVLYGYNQSTNNIWHYDASVDFQANDRLDLWTGYSYSDQSGVTPYLYDHIDIARELDTGFMYKLDPKDAIAVNVSYDLDLRRAKDVDYTWRRNLHCWQADITWRAKRSELKVKLGTAAW